MESEWRRYLREHMPELYEQMLSDVCWDARWRDEKIAKLEEAISSAYEFLSMVPFHLPEKHDPHIDHFLERAEEWLTPWVNPKEPPDNA